MIQSRSSAAREGRPTAARWSKCLLDGSCVTTRKRPLGAALLAGGMSDPPFLQREHEEERCGKRCGKSGGKRVAARRFSRRFSPSTRATGDGFEPDAIDTLERLTGHFKAGLRRGRTIEASRVLAPLDGIAGAAAAVEAASAGLATAIEKRYSR
ncbi:MAG: hypothetical protein V9G18_22380 [Albidovulum sp.]